MQNLIKTIKTSELRKKIFFTLGIIVFFRLGSFIPLPSVNYTNVRQCIHQDNGFGSIQNAINMFSGGALLQLSIFALGIMPYITASIIIQLLRIIIPHFESLHEEGQAGQKKLTQYTRYLTVVFSILNSATIIALIKGNNLFQNCNLPLISNQELSTLLLIVITLTTGTIVMMWMSEMVNEKGVGNGMSILILTSVTTGFPKALNAVYSFHGWSVLLLIIVISCILITLVVFVEQSQRSIKIQYTKRYMANNDISKEIDTYIPIKVNMAGVVPVIFASSLLMMPQMLAQFFISKNSDNIPDWVIWIQNNLASGDNILYLIIYFLLIVFFSYFYVYITFNPEEISNNIMKYGGIIPGLRAGKSTADYLNYILARLTAVGSLYLGIIALLPLLALYFFDANQSFLFGGTSLLIIVGVGLDTVRQLNVKLEQYNYKGLLKNE